MHVVHKFCASISNLSCTDAYLWRQYTCQQPTIITSQLVEPYGEEKPQSNFRYNGVKPTAMRRLVFEG